MAAPQPSRLNGYLADTDPDGKAVLEPPAAPDSPQGRADRLMFEATLARC